VSANTFTQWLVHVSYKDFSFNVRSLVGVDDMERFYLQVSWPGVDAISGLPRQCKGRKWFLSEHMTKSEVVQTALAAVLAIEEHEARELFMYKSHPVFGPHYDVDALAALCDYGALDKRK
jgi:hypothetical protein